MKVSNEAPEALTCKGCVWFDQCGSDKRCDDYDGANYHELAEEEYRADLNDRHESYMSGIIF